MSCQSPRKAAAGISCPTRPASDVKGKSQEIYVGGSLSYLKLSTWACVAVNPKRILNCIQSWSQKPFEINRPTLSTERMVCIALMNCAAHVS